jgi:integrase
MNTLGDRPAAEVTTREINQVLADVAAAGASPRTVNEHRQLICAVYSYACREATFGLDQNPALAADRRVEPERARLVSSPEEVEALARALADGLHRDPARPAVSEDEDAPRAAEDRQDAELVRVAAYAGLRRGELLALRWRDVDFTRRKLVVRRAISGGVEAASTKSRRAREVPLPDQAAGALDRLSQRGDFTRADDYVFCNRLGPPPRRLSAPPSGDPRPRRRRTPAAPLPRPPPHLRLPPRRRRHRPGIREGGDGPLAHHDDRALPARAVGERAGGAIHACIHAG